MFDPTCAGQSPAGNRKARRAAGQRGAMTNTQRMGVGLVSLAAVMAIAAPAMADPIINPLPPSSGTNPTPQTVNPNPPAVPEQIAPSSQGAGVIPDPPSNQWRPNPNTYNGGYDQGGYDQGTVFQQTNWNPAPQIPQIFSKPAPPMILPEPGILRVGKYQTEKPTWMTMAELNSVNRWSAYIESRIAQYWISQGFSEKEADRRAASMVVGGLVGGGVAGAAGGAAGFALGVVPGALAGAGIGALAGLGIGFGVGLATGIPLLPIPGYPGVWITQGAVGALIGAPIGAGIGAVAGGLAGGLIGATVVGVPMAALGVGLGSVFGGGDPNQNINQPWMYHNGKGEIVPKDNALEFDWNGTKSVPALSKVQDAHVNLQVKDDDTWVVKFGDERWIGATAAQRDKHFYGEIDKAVPGAGQGLKTLLEDKHGVFQNTVRDFLSRTAKDDPKNTQYNPKGDIPDTSKRAERVPYGYTSTPDAWDTPRYADPDNPSATGGSENAYVPGVQAPPTNDQGQATQAAAQVVAQAPAPVQAVAQQAAPQQAVQKPAPVVNTGIKEVDKPAADAQNALRQFIPGIPAA